MILDPNKIVVEKMIIRYSDVYPRGRKDCEDEIIEDTIKLKNLALSKAAKIGIKNPDLKYFWDQHCFCSFAERPMWTLGPNAPVTNSLKSVFANDWRDDPVASFTVVVREKE